MSACCEAHSNSLAYGIDFRLSVTMSDMTFDMKSREKGIASLDGFQLDVCRNVGRERKGKIMVAARCKV